VGEPILAFLDGRAQGGLAGRELGDHHAPLVLLGTEASDLLKERFVGRGEPRVVRGQHGEVQRLPLLMERLVLLRLAGLTRGPAAAGSRLAFPPRPDRPNPVEDSAGPPGVCLASRCAPACTPPPPPLPR